MHMEHEDVGSNPSQNRPFDDVLETRISRRAVMGGGLAAAASTFFFGLQASPAAGRAPAAAGTASKAGTVLSFDAIPLGFGNEVVVPDGYEATPFLPWGTPIMYGAGSSDYPANAAEQERRIGLGHDGMWFFPHQGRTDQGILCINFEYGTDAHIQNGTGVAPGTPEFVALSQAVHGVGVVEIRRKPNGTWIVVLGSRKNRRITPNTPVAFSGPAADSPLLENPAGNHFAGTVNNCANGKTPWGTYLTCEENFNGYFGSEAPFTATPEQARYGFSAGGFGYAWHVHDRRWDLNDAAFANESNRFGWIVEINPRRPDELPVKRTALGRFKHENVEIVEGKDMRIVAYMGDDERFDYVYKFVSTMNWKKLINRGMSPLDHGTLYAARFNDDGTGDWLPLTLDDPALAARFSGMDDLLVHARIAGDIVGATPMDRPEWAAANPQTGDVFITMTNNTRRTEANAANPRVPNPDGHIIKIADTDMHVGETFAWDIFLLAGPADDPTATTDADSEHGSPDGLAFDADGCMIIMTDGGQPEGSNDQMLMGDPATGEVRRFLTGVKGCEVTGYTPLTGDEFMVNLQHPGDGDPAISTWPGGPGAVPRDACVVISPAVDAE